MQVPFIIYADSEVLNKPVEDCADNPEISYSHQIAKQVPCSYCYVVVRSDGEAKTPVIYRGQNVTEPFLSSLQAELEEIHEVFHHPADMCMSDADYKCFTNAMSS